MEEGQLRCDVNVSVRKIGREKTKIHKNKSLII